MDTDNQLFRKVNGLWIYYRLIRLDQVKWNFSKTHVMNIFISGVYLVHLPLIDPDACTRQNDYNELGPVISTSPRGEIL